MARGAGAAGGGHGTRRKGLRSPASSARGPRRVVAFRYAPSRESTATGTNFSGRKRSKVRKFCSQTWATEDLGHEVTHSFTSHTHTQTPPPPPLPSLPVATAEGSRSRSVSSAGRDWQPGLGV